MSASWYDVLGVDRDADTERIRTAWRDAIADLDPGDRRFTLYNDAAKVLLDPSARADYDAALPAETPPEPAADAEADGDPTPVTDGGTADETAVETGPQPKPVPAWLLAALAITAAVLAAVAAFVQFGGDDPAVREDAADEARAVAVEQFGNVLTYRWDDLEGSRERAAAVMTSDYYDREFARVWGLVQAGAKDLQAVVTTEVVATGVVRSSDDGRRVELVAVLRNEATNKAGDQGTGYVMVGVTMVEQGGSWLVDDISGLADEGEAPDAEEQPEPGSEGGPSPSE